MSFPRRAIALDGVFVVLRPGAGYLPCGLVLCHVVRHALPDLVNGRPRFGAVVAGFDSFAGIGAAGCSTGAA